MARKARVVALNYGLRWFLIMLGVYVSYGTEDDVLCLKKIKASLEDPLHYLEPTWDFSNKTEGAICRFNGIECWHPDESRVLSIRVNDMGLKGQFPVGLESCKSLISLDLSGNRLSGTIPSDINGELKYMTSLDLSNNDLSGEIPESLSNCSYLTYVDLSHNQLSGQIPQQLGLLQRVRSFNVSNNDLSGPVPTFVSISMSEENYAHNSGLCGGPLDACPLSSNKSNLWYIVGGVGGLFLLIILAGIALSLKLRKTVVRRTVVNDPEGHKWANTKGAKTTKVVVLGESESIQQKSMDDIIKATNDFNSGSIIASGLTGKMYKAIFPDGKLLLVKRVQELNQTKEEFLCEMDSLGLLKHPNLLPPLGFCEWNRERFLVYKYMAKGNLYDQLHPLDPEVKIMDWPTRLKIGIGTAKALAWLHENRDLKIIHRNISSKCILLDNEFEPQLHDLCLSRLINPSQAHFSTFARGEVGDLGYMAPEYTNIHRLGTVLLELVTGEKPTEVVSAPDKFKSSLLAWIDELSRTHSNFHCLIDKSLLEKGDDDELSQFLTVACNCVSPVPKERPTLLEVYQQLLVIGHENYLTTVEQAMVPVNNEDANLVDEIIVSLG